MGTSIDLAVDTSALTAILLGEPDAPALLTAVTAAPRVGLCAPNRTELFLVIRTRLGDAGVERAKALLRLQQIQTIPLDEALADSAADAYRRFGKGRHPAGLNFGDCFSYALANRERVPLLFKGADFSKTDLRAVVYSPPP
jgi:ribonuclease VapC